MASTLEKLKAQHPSIYIPASQADGFDGDNSGLPDDIKPLSDMTNATAMDISRLVTHLSKVVANTREEVSTLLHELQPLKEKLIMLKEDCDEKKKVRTLFWLGMPKRSDFSFDEFFAFFLVYLVNFINSLFFMKQQKKRIHSFHHGKISVI